jgi:hypothetical protein
MRKLLNGPVKNAALYARLLQWIDETRAGEQVTEPRLRGIRWHQGTWYSGPPGGRVCCLGSAAVLASGYRLTIKRGYVTIVRPWYRPGWTGGTVLARKVLGLTRYEASLLFAPNITRRALEAARRCFDEGRPITGAILTAADAPSILVRTAPQQALDDRLCVR